MGDVPSFAVVLVVLGGALYALDRGLSVAVHWRDLRRPEGDGGAAGIAAALAGLVDLGRLSGDVARLADDVKKARADIHALNTADQTLSNNLGVVQLNLQRQLGEALERVTDKLAARLDKQEAAVANLAERVAELCGEFRSQRDKP